MSPTTPLEALAHRPTVGERRPLQQHRAWPSGSTESGAAFLPEARSALEALDRARPAAVPLAAGLCGSLSVGVLSGLSVVDVPAPVGEFHRRHPDVRFRTQT
ncbi:hypothetical protein ABZ379_31425 [Streptomyces canus]|uniref:hypothetical protein n=1 Tax=Streptomyces canus TaxID=58343 RepID=UPI0033F7738D